MELAKINKTIVENLMKEIPMGYAYSGNPKFEEGIWIIMQRSAFFVKEENICIELYKCLTKSDKPTIYGGYDEEDAINLDDLKNHTSFKIVENTEITMKYEKNSFIKFKDAENNAIFVFEKDIKVLDKPMHRYSYKKIENNILAINDNEELVAVFNPAIDTEFLGK